jgi:hypothetical protein
MRCSFCGSSQKDVTGLIHGADRAAACFDCIELMHETTLDQTDPVRIEQRRSEFQRAHELSLTDPLRPVFPASAEWLAWSERRTARGGESPDDVEPDDGHDGRCDVGHCRGSVVQVVVTEDDGLKLHLCAEHAD